MVFFVFFFLRKWSLLSVGLVTETTNRGLKKNWCDFANILHSKSTAEGPQNTTANTINTTNFEIINNANTKQFTKYAFQSILLAVITQFTKNPSQLLFSSPLYLLSQFSCTSLSAQRTSDMLPEVNRSH